MQKMIQQMREGAPFDYLAKTYSEASTKSVGGDLGWVRPAMLPDQLAGAAQEMQPGQVAGPIQLPTGFSILYLAEKRKVLTADPKDAKLSLRQIAITFPKGTTEAAATARAGEFATATRAIKGCGDVANVAQAQSAEVVDRDGIAIKELPPALQNMILPLQVGQVTQPFGSVEDGVRVLVLCGRDDPKEAYEPSVEQVQNQIEEQRTNLRAQRMARHGDGIAGLDRRRTVRRSVERLRQPGPRGDQRQHRRAAAFRSLAAQPNGVVDQFAHGAAVLRSGITALGEPARDQRVRRRTLIARRRNDPVEQVDRRLAAGCGSHLKASQSCGRCVSFVNFGSKIIARSKSRPRFAAQRIANPKQKKSYIGSSNCGDLVQRVG